MIFNFVNEYAEDSSEKCAASARITTVTIRPRTSPAASPIVLRHTMQTIPPAMEALA